MAQLALYEQICDWLQCLTYRQPLFSETRIGPAFLSRASTDDFGTMELDSLLVSVFELM